MPSTAEITHELRMLLARSAIGASLAAAPGAVRDEQTAEPETLVAQPDMHFDAGSRDATALLRRSGRAPQPPRTH